MGKFAFPRSNPPPAVPVAGGGRTIAVPIMPSHPPGLSEHSHPPQWLEGAHGRLAFYPYPAAAPRFHLLIVHGFSEHSGWWHHVALAMQEQGVSAYLFDNYHHGHSDGALGDVPDFGILADGLRCVLESGVGPFRENGAPLVVLAHSNGALTILHALRGGLALAPPLCDGLVFGSPFLGMPPRAAVMGTSIATVISWFMPRFPVPIPRVPKKLTSDQGIWDRYLSDPLRYGYITARFFLAMRRALKGVDGARLPLPLLLMFSTADGVVSRKAIRRFFAAVECEDKILKTYHGLGHELFNETCWEEMVADVLQWADSRLQPPAAERAAP